VTAVYRLFGIRDEVAVFQLRWVRKRDAVGSAGGESGGAQHGQSTYY
jgi:hypothetical protein